MADERTRKDSFYRLDPETVLQATEEGGFHVTGEMTQLNSYENRVFDLRLEKGQERERVIAKFYRPGRWSRECLLEEHGFLREIAGEGFDVAAPLTLKGGSTLGERNGLYFCLFPKVQGRLPQELLLKDLESVGRLLAQVHNVGARRKFKYRPIPWQAPFSPWETLDFMRNWVAPELWPRYERVVIELLETLESEVDPAEFQRIHGDCHRGNIISFNDRLTLFDFDDCGTGPVIQDFWMLFTSEFGDDERDLMLGAYEELRDFPRHQIRWIPILRALRVFVYGGWIARRWEDPFFPRTFPNFGSYTYWAEETEALEKILWSLSRIDD